MSRRPGGPTLLTAQDLLLLQHNQATMFRCPGHGQVFQAQALDLFLPGHLRRRLQKGLRSGLIRLGGNLLAGRLGFRGLRFRLFLRMFRQAVC